MKQLATLPRARGLCIVAALMCAACSKSPAAMPATAGAAAVQPTAGVQPAAAGTTAGAQVAGAPGSGTGAGAGGSGMAAPTPGGAGGSAGTGQIAAGVGGQAGRPPVEPVTCPASTLVAGDTTLRTLVGGRDGGMRTYIVHVPASYDGTKPVPLMVNFHPLFGTGAGQRSGSGWAEIGDREGIITAFPDGYDAAWDIGNCCTRGDVDDMAFAKAIVSEISKAACIDANRVYASGYSMGAGMSHLLGCKAADIFAAVAPSAFDLTEENHIPCEPSRPITVFSHRGMTDSVVPYAGGPTTPPNGTPVTVTMLGAVGTFDEWSRIDKCTDEPVTSGNCQRRTKCANGVEVVLCQNSGHSEGPATVIWETLKKHGLRGPL